MGTIPAPDQQQHAGTVMPSLRDIAQRPLLASLLAIVHAAKAKLAHAAGTQTEL